MKGKEITSHSLRCKMINKTNKVVQIMQMLIISVFSIHSGTLNFMLL